MIKLKQVSIKYVKDYYSLYNINLDIESNTLLIGDETSGNNFLLRLLAKIDKGYEGEILIDTISLKQIKDRDLNLAYIPKTPYLFENKTILENLIYPLKIRKIKKIDAILRAKTAIRPYFLKIFEIFNKTNCNLLKNDGRKNNGKLNLQNKDLETNQYNKSNNDINTNVVFNVNKTNIQNVENLFENFLNLKVKKLDVSAKKIITLLRAKIREPKYVLIENLFENLDESFFDLANKIILDFIDHSTIIAAQNDEKKTSAYNNFEQIVFDAGSIKRDGN